MILDQKKVSRESFINPFSPKRFCFYTYGFARIDLSTTSHGNVRTKNLFKWREEIKRGETSAVLVKEKKKDLSTQRKKKPLAA